MRVKDEIQRRGGTGLGTRWGGLTGVLLVGAALRILYFGFAFARTGDISFMWTGDTRNYVKAAQSLLEYAWLTPELSRTPGYPALLALGIMAGSMPIVLFGIQLLCQAGTVLLIGRLAADLGSGPRASSIGRWMAAIDPQMIAYTSLLMPEVAFVFLLTLAAHLLLQRGVPPSLRSAVAVGALVGAAILLKPVAMYWAPPVVASVALVWRMRGGVSLSRGAALWVVVCVLAGTPAVLWTQRNRVLFGLSSYSSLSSWAKYGFVVAPIIARKEGIGEEVVRRRLLAEMKAEQDVAGVSSLPEVERVVWMSKWMDKETNQFLRHRWKEFFPIYLRRVAVILASPGAGDVLKPLSFYDYSAFADQDRISGNLEETAKGALRQGWPETATRVGLVGWLLFVYLGALMAFGATASVRLRAVPLIGAAAYFVFMGAVADGYARYRVHGLPFVIALSAVGWATFPRPLASANAAARSGTRP